jgi:plasmid maintenance system killer protein
MIEDIRYPKFNWAIFFILVLLMFMMLFYFEKAWGQERDPKAVTLAEKTIQAMGGVDGWKQVSAIRFNFQVEPQGRPAFAAKHLWDRKNSRDHVEGKNKDGKLMVAWVDLRTKDGQAWTDGKKLEGEELKKALEWAYSRWINDTYWLIMPFKTLDAGVTIKHEGEKDGHEILHVSFSKVGETPGDQYWAHINKQNGLMDRWEYTLQDQTKGDWSWVEWKDFGKIKLSQLKKKSDGKANIRFEPLAVLESADPAFFGSELKLLD